MVPWEGYASDETMGTFAPILLYWLYAGGYQLVLHRRPLQRYRLHTAAEEEEKNLVTLPAVVRGVLLQQLMQAIVAMILFMITSDSSMVVVQPSIVVQMFQFLVAMLVMDTWQYFVHRYMHQNKFLYRHIHSQHHRLISVRHRGSLQPPIGGAPFGHCRRCYVLLGLWYDAKDCRVLLLFCCTQDGRRPLWTLVTIQHLPAPVPE